MRLILAVVFLVSSFPFSRAHRKAGTPTNHLNDRQDTDATVTIIRPRSEEQIHVATGPYRIHWRASESLREARVESIKALHYRSRIEDDNFTEHLLSDGHGIDLEGGFWDWDEMRSLAGAGGTLQLRLTVGGNGISRSYDSGRFTIVSPWNDMEDDSRLLLRRDDSKKSNSTKSATDKDSGTAADSDKASQFIIIGIGVGLGLLTIFIIVLLILIFRRGRKKRKRTAPPRGDAHELGTDVGEGKSQRHSVRTSKTKKETDEEKKKEESEDVVDPAKSLLEVHTEPVPEPAHQLPTPMDEIGYSSFTMEMEGSPPVSPGPYPLRYHQRSMSWHDHGGYYDYRDPPVSSIPTLPSLSPISPISPLSPISGLEQIQEDVEAGRLAIRNRIERGHLSW